jgi:crotonobetainyl-CoA dehydrogenase
MNRGWPQLMANFEIERLALCAASVGAAEGAYEDAVAYANQRVQFGKPIGSFQAVQHILTDMAVKIENMRNYIYKIAWMMDKANRCAPSTPCASCMWRAPRLR